MNDREDERDVRILFLKLAALIAKRRGDGRSERDQRPEKSDHDQRSSDASRNTPPLKPVDTRARLRAGAHLLPAGAPDTAAFDQGHVTSVAHSPTLERWIGLGLLARGPERLGERVRAFDPVRGGDTLVEVCAPVFVDPEGQRSHG